MKTCKGCGSLKPVNEFYTHPLTKDGRQGKCKECQKVASRQNRKSNAAHYKAYDKARANRPDRVAARQAYAQTERGRERINAGSYAWRERNPEKYKAHTTVNNAIRSGKLQRQGCEVCGEKAHAHHDDYDRPLDVRWLCHAHHREHHAREG